MSKQNNFSEQTENLILNLKVIAQFAQAIHNGISEAGSDCTLADLYAAEVFVNTFRKAMTTPAVSASLCNLTDNAIIDKADLCGIGIKVLSNDPNDD